MNLEDLIEPQAIRSIRKIQKQMDSLRMATDPVRELRKQMEAVTSTSNLTLNNSQSSISQISKSWSKDIQPALEAVRKLQKSLSPLNEINNQSHNCQN